VGFIAIVMAAALGFEISVTAATSLPTMGQETSASGPSLERFGDQILQSVLGPTVSVSKLKEVATVLTRYREQFPNVAGTGMQFSFDAGVGVASRIGIDFAPILTNTVQFGIGYSQNQADINATTMVSKDLWVSYSYNLGPSDLATPAHMVSVALKN
jgi:hypothetical protein